MHIFVFLHLTVYKPGKVSRFLNNSREAFITSIYLIYRYDFGKLSQSMFKKIQVIINYCRDYGMIINKQKTRFMVINDIFDTREVIL